ncbi:DedA family protein [Amycolatopsis anabasis]|uniref:DedA family protein n=1 Tax=Amycolatopsis anabasis TaxID=1840409 RepID=UPI00131D64DB|nr:DedA family protein [Amycolatopsis anabasis]
MPDLHALLAGLPPVPVLLVAGLLLVAEAGLLAGVVLPGASAVLVLGFLASQGVVGYLPAVVTAAAAAPIGGQLAYLTGRRRGCGRLLGPARERARRLLTERGGPAVTLAQWVVVARTVTPRLAGASGMAHRRFTSWHLPSALAWAACLVTVGRLAGEAYDRAGSVLGILGAIALTGLVLVSTRHRGARLGDRDDVQASAVRQ